MPTYEEDKQLEREKWILVHLNTIRNFIKNHYIYRNGSLVHEAEQYDKDNPIWNDMKKNVSDLHKIGTDPHKISSQIDAYRLFCKGQQKMSLSPDDFNYQLLEKRKQVILKLGLSGKKFL